MKVKVINDLKEYNYQDVIQVSLVTDDGCSELAMEPAKFISILLRDKRVARFQLNTSIVLITEEEK